MIATLSGVLILVSLILQFKALVPLRRLIAMLPEGSVRNMWLSMTMLIFVFIAGYCEYLFLMWGQQTEWHDLLIPGLFLFGGLFVKITIDLSLQTAIDLKRIDLLEAENIADPLTQTFNRRYLDRRLDEEVARSKRYSLDLSILLLDIDHFKHVNDTYGHQAGDLALTSLGYLLKTELRELDVIARYGGEEFLVICTNTAVKGATLVAERLRQQVESLQIEIPDNVGGSQTIQIQISVGAASMGSNINSKENLIQAADQALYRAKNEGRNRVIIASSEIENFAMAV